MILSFVPRFEPHLWAHNKSFRVMTEGWANQTRTIDISEVGSVLTKIESFHTGSLGRDQRIDSFSLTTYRIKSPLWLTINSRFAYSTSGAGSAY